MLHTHTHTDFKIWVLIYRLIQGHFVEGADAFVILRQEVNIEIQEIQSALGNRISLENNFNYLINGIIQMTVNNFFRHCKRSTKSETQNEKE